MEYEVLARTSAVLRCHSVDLLTVALNTHRDVVRQDEEYPGTPLRDVLTTVVMSWSAVSAHIAELGGLGLLRGFELPPAVQEASAHVRDTPVERGRALRQYQAAAEALGVPLDRGRAPLQDTTVLLKLRNAIVHPTSLEVADATGRLKAPRCVRWLEAKGMLASTPETDDDEAPPPSWYERVWTVSVSEWAYRSALALIRHIKLALPTEPCYPPDMMTAIRGQLDAADP